MKTENPIIVRAGENPPDQSSDVVTLRDLFAAAALVGFEANGRFGLGCKDTASQAYRIADAMLEERAKR